MNKRQYNILKSEENAINSLLSDNNSIVIKGAVVVMDAKYNKKKILEMPSTCKKCIHYLYQTGRSDN